MYRVHVLWYPCFVLDQHECYPEEGTEVTEGEEVIFACEVKHYGYKAPTLRWHDASGAEMTSQVDEAVEDPNLLRYQKVYVFNKKY